MTTRRKLSLTFLLIMLVATALLISVVSFGFYNLGSSQADQKAKLTTELIKYGLTAHMINGTMDNRDFFLSSISKSDNVDEIWITRSPLVTEQFGNGFYNESARDEVDLEVIESKKPVRKLFENTKNVKLRFTSPYIATSQGKPNCLSCHNVKEGEVLGTVSMVFDITQTRKESINTIIYISFIAMILVFFILFSFNISLRPVWSLLNSINHVIESANDGDFSQRIPLKNKNGESKQLATWINDFFNNLQSVLININKNMNDFFVSNYETKSETNPLLNMKKTVHEMSNIYRFKKSIEEGKDKAAIYDGLANVLKNDIKLNNFNFYESQLKTGIISCVYKSSKHIVSNSSIHHRFSKINQSKRTNTFKDAYSARDDNQGFYLCLPYSISDELDLLIHFTFSTQSELEKAKNLLPSVENYIESAKLELKNKNLTQMLLNSSQTDQLTGLYNRKFLEEFAKKTASQIKRGHNHYAILMLDIDFFKSVNDTYGHQVGDNVIQILARTIFECIRESDLAFRYGGEEFLIMLYNCDDESIEDIAQRIRNNFANIKIQIDPDTIISKTVSIGYSSFPTDHENIWECIKFADVALYKAKQTGRNKVVRFDNLMLKKEK